MANWCVTEYTLVGDPGELEAAYNLMRELERMRTPRVESDFGPRFLGCLVDALGGDWRASLCRGEWFNLEYGGKGLTFATETAYGPLNDAFDMLCRRFPTLSYYYRAIEPGCEVFQTNDFDGGYYPERYWASVSDDDWDEKTFIAIKDALRWFKEKTGKRFDSLSELDNYVDEHGYRICSIYPIEVVDHETDVKTRQIIKAVSGIEFDI